MACLLLGDCCLCLRSELGKSEASGLRLRGLPTCRLLGTRDNRFYVHFCLKLLEHSVVVHSRGLHVNQVP